MLRPSKCDTARQPSWWDCNASKTARERVRWSLSVCLWACLMVSATDGFPGSERGVTVTAVDGKSPAEFVSERHGKAWAVVIGIDQYRHVPKLTYAATDAKSIAALLKLQGFDVLALYDTDATRQAILHELGDRLPNRVGEQDRVVIFYAGHGETRKFGGGTTMGYLLPVDGQASSLSATAIDMGLIQSLAQALPAKQILFLIDSCYGGIAGQRFRSIAPMTETYLRAITREKGRQLITAGGADQQAVEGSRWGHSAFTYYLLEGIGNGLADLNEDGIIPTSELYAYLDQRVYAAAQLLGHTQRPQLWSLSSDQGEFVFIPHTPEGTIKRRPAVAESSAEVAALHAELERVKAELKKVMDARAEAALTHTPAATAPSSQTAKSFSTLEQACEKQNGDKCFQLARLYTLGEKIGKDLSRGASLFEKGCRAGHANSCTALGSLLWIGEGIQQDRALSQLLWKHACKIGSQDACTLLLNAQTSAG